METECRFGTQYQPSPNGRVDPALLAHLPNCEECQEQVVVVDSRLLA